jgi:hypothetical protein
MSTQLVHTSGVCPRWIQLDGEMERKGRERGTAVEVATDEISYAKPAKITVYVRVSS